jgi:hypothetical protein
VRKSLTFAPLQVFCSAKLRGLRTKECRNLRVAGERVGRKSAADMAGVGHNALDYLGPGQGASWSRTC